MCPGCHFQSPFATQYNIPTFSCTLKKFREYSESDLLYEETSIY